MTDAAKKLLQHFTDDTDVRAVAAFSDEELVAADELVTLGLARWELSLTPRGTRRVVKTRQAAEIAKSDATLKQKLAEAEAEVERLRRQVSADTAT